MGEARRRKKLDPNFGKPKPPEIDDVIYNRKESEWQRELGLTKKEWKRIKPTIRIVESANDVDDSIDALWIYKKNSRQTGVSFTGTFAAKYSLRYL